VPKIAGDVNVIGPGGVRDGCADAVHAVLAAVRFVVGEHAGRDDADFLKQLRSDPEVAKHFKNGELEKLCSIDFHLKEVTNRFRKLGL